MSISKSRLSQLMLKVWQGALKPVPANANNLPYTSFGFLNVSFTLFGDDYRDFEKIVDELANDNLLRREFKRKDIENDTSRAMADLILTGKTPNINDSKKVVDDLVSILKRNIRNWLAAIPIENLEIQSNIKIGAVKFTPGGRELNIWKKRFAQLGQKSASLPDAKKAFRELAQSELDKHLGPQTGAYAVALIESGPKARGDLAIEAVEEALDVLRLMQYFFGLQSVRHTAFGITGLPARKNIIGFYLSEDFSHASFGGSWKGPLVTQTFTKDDISKMKRNTLFKALVSIVENTNRNKMQKKIISALEWFGAATSQYHPHIKLLEFVITVEVLLSVEHDKHEGRIQANVAERLAFLLSKSHDVLARLQIIDRMKGIYDVRSRIVHEGFNDIKERDVEKAEFLALNAIVAMAKRKDIKKPEDLASWVDYQKLR